MRLPTSILAFRCQLFMMRDSLSLSGMGLHFVALTYQALPLDDPQIRMYFLMGGRRMSNRITTTTV